MNNGTVSGKGLGGLRALRQFVTPRPVVERCDLCGATLGPQHRHLVDPGERRLMCACDPCSILFPTDGQTRYRQVPRDSRHVPDFALSDETWASLYIPVGLVFFFWSSTARKVMAVYPSPGGPTEMPVEDEAWVELTTHNPVLATLMPDVEALLVNRINGKREYLIAPIDECYKLTGILRKHWQGFSGGAEAWDRIGEFFDALSAGALPGTVRKHG